MRTEAKQNIARIQEENCKDFNRKCKPEVEYLENDLVSIKRTQFSSGIKQRERGKFYGPYKIVKKLQACMKLLKLGPICITTVAENIKSWQSKPNYRQESLIVGRSLCDIDQTHRV